MTSKTRQQLELLPSQQAHVEEVTPDLIARVRRRPTFLAAWNYAQEISCLEDKAVYEALDIDGSHWTKIKRGRASPPADERFTRFAQVVRNEIPLIWHVEAHGYDFTTLRKHRSDTERRLEAVERENADLRRLLNLKIEVFEGRK